MFITVFTAALRLFLSRDRLISSIPPHPISPISILTLSTHLRLSLTSSLFLSGFPPITYTHSSSPHLCYMLRPSHPSWLGHSKYTWRRIQVSGSLVTTAWRALSLRVEETSTRYVGWLWIYWISSCGPPTWGGSTGWEFTMLLTD
jgi:hypothetical protein